MLTVEALPILNREYGNAVGRLEDNMNILRAFNDVDISFIGVNNAIIAASWLGQIVAETKNTVEIKSDCAAYTNGLSGAKFICKFDIYITICYNESDKKIMVVKGYGVYVYHRDLQYLSKLMAILENSCKILHFHSILEGNKPSHELFDF